MTSLGVGFEYPIAKTGIVGSIGKGEPIVALRADMDALPIQVGSKSLPRTTHGHLSTPLSWGW